MFKRIIAFIVCICFFCSTLHVSYADVGAGSLSLQLPVPGARVVPAADFMPLTLKGLAVHPQDPLKFDFIMDTGNTGLSLKAEENAQALREESLKIMKYFLAALTIPEEDLWVNLSPYEKGRTIENNLASTLMGRDLLAQDYILKQLTSSVIYPEDELGQKFWSEVYKKAANQFGTTQVPINTFNKVWIVPSQAVVWESAGKVMIIKSHLKVMLEQDYVALQHNRSGEFVEPEDYLAYRKANLPAVHENHSSGQKQTQTDTNQIVRDIVLPVLEQQVNEGAHFAQLRQMFQAMILATWYKKSLKNSIVSKIYSNQKKTKGIQDVQAAEIEGIYQQYLAAFKKGAFNYIKQDIDPIQHKSIPRKYFSGGFSLKNRASSLLISLVVWSGVLTTAQQQALAQAIAPVGQTIQANTKFIPIEEDNFSQDQEDVTKLSIDELFNLLIKRHDPSSNSIAAFELGRRAHQDNPREAQIVTALSNALKSPRPQVRLAVIEALGKYASGGNQNAIKQLKDILKRKDSRMVYKTILTIGELKNIDFVSAVVDFIKIEESPDMKIVAYEALGKLGEPQEQEYKFYYYIATEQWEKIVGMGESVIPLVKREFHKTDRQKESETYQQLKGVLKDLGVGWFGRLSGSWQFTAIVTPVVVSGSLLGVWLGWKKMKKHSAVSLPPRFENDGIQKTKQEWAELLSDNDSKLRLEAATRLSKKSWQASSVQEKILYLLALKDLERLKQEPEAVVELVKLMELAEKDGKYNLYNQIVNALISLGYKKELFYFTGAKAGPIDFSFTDKVNKNLAMTTEVSFNRSARTLIGSQGQEFERVGSFYGANNSIFKMGNGVARRVRHDKKAFFDPEKMEFLREAGNQEIIQDIYSTESGWTLNGHPFIDVSFIEGQNFDELVVTAKRVLSADEIQAIQALLKRMIDNEKLCIQFSMPNVMYGYKERDQSRKMLALLVDLDSLKYIPMDKNRLIDFYIDAYAHYEWSQYDQNQEIKTFLEGLKESKDRAMVGVDTPGGVDFNANHFDLQIRRDTQGVVLPMDQQPFTSSSIQGFEPSIIEIKAIDISVFLGVVK